MQRIDYSKGGYFAAEGDFSSAGSARFRLASKLAQGTAAVTVGSNVYRRALLADSFGLGGGTLLYGFEAIRNNGPWEVPERVR